MIGPKIWSQGVARRSLIGGATHNPSPAATALLGRTFGKRGVRRAVRRVGKLRRSSHRGNPLPAVVATVAGHLPGVKNLFKTPSEKRAAGPAQALVNAAVQGNLTAAKAIAERTELGIQKERAIWRKAALQIPPKIMQLLQKYAEQVPGVDHSSPEAAAESAIARAVDANALEAAARAEGATRSAAAERRAAQAAARGERREELLANVAGVGLQALAGRGRSLRRAPRRRRAKPRAFRF